METEADPRSSVFQSLGLSVSCMQIKIELDSGSHLDEETELPNRRQFLCPEDRCLKDHGILMLEPSHAPSDHGAGQDMQGLGGVSEMPGHLRNEGNLLAK